VAALRVAAAVIAAAVTAVGAEGARQPLDFLFEATTARPGERVTVRPVQRVSLSPHVRLYLVRADVARRVRSRLDSRLHFIGSLRLRATRSALTFTVPPLESGSYTVAYSRGRTFSARSDRRLKLFAPPATADACPVTTPNGNTPPRLKPGRWYGNGVLWTMLPPGSVIADDSLSWKLGWLPTGIGGTLSVQGRRIDARSAPMDVLDVNWGYNTSNGRGGWASAVVFPSEGCWKITGRVEDVSLSYVVKVVRA
jgi:hypothetical protein